MSYWARVLGISLALHALGVLLLLLLTSTTEPSSAPAGRIKMAIRGGGGVSVAAKLNALSAAQNSGAKSVAPATKSVQKHAAAKTHSAPTHKSSVSHTPVHPPVHPIPKRNVVQKLHAHPLEIPPSAKKIYAEKPTVKNETAPTPSQVPTAAAENESSSPLSDTVSSATSNAATDASSTRPDGDEKGPLGAGSSTAGSAGAEGNGSGGGGEGGTAGSGGSAGGAGSAGQAGNGDGSGPPNSDATLIRATLKTPEYTRAALRAGLQGSFTISVFVDEFGNVKEIEFAQPVGYDMDSRIEAAMKACKFRPRTNRSGKPIPGWVDFQFKLEIP